MNKNDNVNVVIRVVGYIVIFFMGCICMYGIFHFFPAMITENITKTEKDVTVTDTGIADAVEKIYDAVVVVSTYKNDRYIASGSGFIYAKEGNTYHILTNYHVIENGDKVNVTFTDGTVHETKISGFDQYADIAVLTLESNEDLTIAELGSSENARVGDTTFAVGAPLASAYNWTVSRGIVSGKNREVEVSIGNSVNSDYVMLVLQTDASINSGNSGGPLCNSNGEVIGITSLKLVSDGVEGMGFAIPIEDALSKADEILDGKISTQPYLGIGMINLVEAYYYPQYYSLIQNSGLTSGVIISKVDNNSPSAKAGLEAGDIITGFDDKNVPNLAYLRYYLYQHNVGDKINLKIYRNGSEKTVTVTLGTNDQTS